MLCVSLGHWASTRFCDALPLDIFALGHVALHSIAPNISRDIDPEIFGGRAAFMWLFMGQGIPARPPTVMCQHVFVALHCNTIFAKHLWLFMGKGKGNP